MTATGTTTAMAAMPPVLRPPLRPLLVVPWVMTEEELDAVLVVLPLVGKEEVLVCTEVVPWRVTVWMMVVSWIVELCVVVCVKRLVLVLVGREVVEVAMLLREEVLLGVLMMLEELEEEEVGVEEAVEEEIEEDELLVGLVVAAPEAAAAWLTVVILAPSRACGTPRLDDGKRWRWGCWRWWGWIGEEEWGRRTAGGIGHDFGEFRALACVGES